MRKNHDRKWTHHGILAEIDSREIPAVLYADHLAGHALIFAYVSAGLGKGDALRRQQGREDQHQQKYTAAEVAAKFSERNNHKKPSGNRPVQNNCMTARAPGGLSERNKD